MEAIILAGGFGTRLKSVVSDVPKPMAPMDEDGTPFLSYLFTFLKKNGITHVVLSIGYMGDVIKHFFAKRHQDISIDYSIENTPLLTGGAIKKALSFCSDDNIFVLNGDTFFDVNLLSMQQNHQSDNADLTIAIKEKSDFDRYGTVIFDNQRITAFREKTYCKSGWINGGIYCMKRELLHDITLQRFSFEKDFMEKQISNIKIVPFKSEGYFVDIGIPEDYYLARQDLSCFRG
ncbi:nucleotidyltransferase family protein [Mitsuokella multacida]|uniref:nucleotidyltransferase family protein n=1 Tax=Mitsuokella multacida TaxID=52226 RepID=UPI003FA2C37B